MVVRLLSQSGADRSISGDPNANVLSRAPNFLTRHRIAAAAYKRSPYLNNRAVAYNLLFT
jgi:hypothetical protein